MLAKEKKYKSAKALEAWNCSANASDRTLLQENTKCKNGAKTYVPFSWVSPIALVGQLHEWLEKDLLHGMQKKSFMRLSSILEVSRYSSTPEFCPSSVSLLLLEHRFSYFYYNYYSYNRCLSCFPQKYYFSLGRSHRCVEPHLGNSNSILTTLLKQGVQLMIDFIAFKTFSCAT